MSEPRPDQQLIVQISDPHIGYGSDVRDPDQALADAVRHILEIEPLPLAIILSGDLTNNGAPAEFSRLRELLEPLPMPVHPIPGNHDERAAMREAFSDHPQIAAAGEFLHYAVDCGPLRLIACDSADPGSNAGALGTERLEWIERQLAAADRPAMLAIHHPPISTGLHGFDGIGLPEPDRRELARIAAAAEGLERIVCGHIHRAIFGSLGGVPTVVCPSVHLQAELDLSPEGRLRLIDEPPALAVHVLREGEPPITHIDPIPQS